MGGSRKGVVRFLSVEGDVDVVSEPTSWGSNGKFTLGIDTFGGEGNWSIAKDEGRCRRDGDNTKNPSRINGTRRDEDFLVGWEGNSLSISRYGVWAPGSWIVPIPKVSLQVWAIGFGLGGQSKQEVGRG